MVPPLAQVVATRQLDPVELVGGMAIALVLLAIVYVVTRYALVALAVWVVRWTFRQLSDVTRLITRVLPLMLLFITFLFINTEVWQVAGTMTAGVLWGSLAVFGVLGTLFIVGRSREEFARIEASTDRDVIAAAVVGTPLEGHADALEGLEVPVPLRGRQRANLLLVMVTAQAVQVALVGVVVWSFFVIFGAVAISIPVQEAWLGDLAVIDPLISLSPDHAVTRQLTRVATFLGGFAGFYATVYAASDNVYRAHFSERITTDLERALAVRRAYLAAGAATRSATTWPRRRRQAPDLRRSSYGGTGRPPAPVWAPRGPAGSLTPDGRGVGALRSATFQSVCAPARTRDAPAKEQHACRSTPRPRTRSSPSTPPPRATPAPPRSRSRCSPAASTTSPSTSRRTSTTTTAAVGCCCWSASAVGCSST